MARIGTDTTSLRTANAAGAWRSAVIGAGPDTMLRCTATRRTNGVARTG